MNTSTSSQDGQEIEKDSPIMRPAASASSSEDITAGDNEKDVSPQEAEKQEQQPQRTGPPPPPNGGYGWVCTVCCAFINAHTWGLNSSYGVFLAYYLANDVFPGATYLEYAFVGSLSISCAMLISPLATLSTRWFGVKPTLFIGVILETASLIGASFARRIWELFLSQGICFGFGMGFLFVASVGVPPQWFTTRRSLANGISACGSGFGGLVYALAAGAMIKSIGLPWTFRVLGIIAGVVNSLCALLLRDRNKVIGSSTNAFDVKLFKRTEYLLLGGYGWFSMLGYVVLIFSLANYANNIGLSSSQASVITALFNLGQGLGRSPIGYFSDTIGRINMAASMTFLCAIFSFAIWIPSNSYGVLIFFAIVGGCVAGTFWATIAPLAAEVVGLKHVPSALNLEWLIIVLPCTFSEPIALEIVGGTGKYIGTQLFVGFMYTTAALCLLFMRGWKIGEVDAVAKMKDESVNDVDVVGAENDEAFAEAARKAGRKRMFTDFWKWRRV